MSEYLDPQNCACANLRQITRAITQVYDAALKPSGLKATQFTILATISQTGDLPLSKLATQLMMDRTTLTRNLQPLMKKGWVREFKADDQRVKLIQLTESGSNCLQEAHPMWEEVQGNLVSNLGDKQFNNLLDDLKKTLQAIPV